MAVPRRVVPAVLLLHKVHHAYLTPIHLEIPPQLPYNTPLMTDLQLILDKPMAGNLISADEAACLLDAPPEDQPQIAQAANSLNLKLNGRRVSFIYNRNLNYSNVCHADCAFCAYCRHHDAPDAYLLTPDEAAAQVAQTPDVDEVCITGGLNPQVDFDYLLRLTRAIHQTAPRAHIHAYSPMEIHWHALRAGISIQSAFEKLIDAGFGSLCGTAAEILDDNVRRQICPGKLNVARWIEVVRAAHQAGLRSTSTVLFGHIETAAHIARHLEHLRNLQLETGGITELIPLIFVPYNTRLGRSANIQQMLPPAQVLRFYAVCRLFMAHALPNLQTSWVKLGLPLALETFDVGVNDIGGTLLSENITRCAGGRHGQAMTVNQLVSAIRSTGRTPVQRDTLYQHLRQQHGSQGLAAG